MKQGDALCCSMAMALSSHGRHGFADDVDFFGIGIGKAVEEAYDSLKREISRIGLTINSTKTKYMIAGRDRGRPTCVCAEVVNDGDVFEIVEEFVYPGTLVICDKGVSREVKRLTQRNIFLSQEQTFVSPKDFRPLNPNPGSDLL